jgi:nucleoporin NUP82
MSEETYNLGKAAADLFRRCERMRIELQEQVRKVAEVAAKVDAVVGADESGEGDEGEPMTGKERVEHRIEVARERSVMLNERAERLRRKMGRLRGKDLSTREVAFVQEIDRLAKTILPPSSDAKADGSASAGDAPGSLAHRFDEVIALKETLLQQAEETSKAEADGDGETKADTKTAAVNVGAEFRKQKLRQVMVLLERETALVEAVMGRLQRLQKV